MIHLSQSAATVEEMLLSYVVSSYLCLSPWVYQSHTSQLKWSGTFHTEIIMRRTVLPLLLLGGLIIFSSTVFFLHASLAPKHVATEKCTYTSVIVQSTAVSMVLRSPPVKQSSANSWIKVNCCREEMTMMIPLEKEYQSFCYYYYFYYLHYYIYYYTKIYKSQ